MTLSITTAVDRLIEARTNRRMIEPLSGMVDDLTITHAYAIQDAFRAAMIRQGRPPIGWKLAATGPTGQAVLGVAEPIHGFLPPDVIANHGTASLRAFVDVGVEAEIAFEIGAQLRGPGVTAAMAMRAVRGIMPALELPDLIFSGSPRVTDFIANSAAAQAIVLGEVFAPPAGFDLASEQVTLTRNGTPLGTNSGSELMGDPVNVVALLANHLAERGLCLEPGDIVMSGGISQFVRPQAGDVFGATFSRLGSVGVRFVE